MTQTPSSVPVIGSSTVYTITCNVTISCTGMCSDNDTLTISWSLNGYSINSSESNNSPFIVSGDNTFTSSLTTMGNISFSHAGLYQCNATLMNSGISDSDTTDFNVKCKLC